MRIARRILLLAAMLLVAMVAAGWRASERRTFEHWFRHLPLVEDVRLSGVRGTLFVAIRREVDSGAESTGRLFGNAVKKWGFSWQSAVTSYVEDELGNSRPASRKSARYSPLGESVEWHWVRIDLVGVPFWSALAASVLLAAGLAAPEVVGPLMRRRRRRGGSCGVCGYNLTGNESGVCPECGRSSLGVVAAVRDGPGEALAAASAEPGAAAGNERGA